MKPTGTLFLLFILMFFLSGCVSEILTGVNMVYDRHHLYKKLNDYDLAGDVSRALFADKRLKCRFCAIDVVVFNQEVLLSGHVPDKKLLREADMRVKETGGYSRFYNQLTVMQKGSSNLKDAWISVLVRGKMIADSSINQDAFKIVTSDGKVYILGEARKKQASKVIQIARKTRGVRKVIDALRYLTYQNLS